MISERSGAVIVNHLCPISSAIVLIGPLRRVVHIAVLEQIRNLNKATSLRRQRIFAKVMLENIENELFQKAVCLFRLR